MQYPNYSAYANITDEEWIERLAAIPPIQPLHHYFFKVKCYSFLKYIAEKVLEAECVESILGEFYEFLSRNNWHVLRCYKKRGNASLATYLSRCTLYYFIKEKKRNEEENFYSLENKEIIEYITNKDYNNLLYNDLEIASFGLNKELKEIKENLSKVGSTIMSGSGSSMIVFSSDEKAFDKVKKMYPEFLIFKTYII